MIQFIITYDSETRYNLNFKRIDIFISETTLTCNLDFSPAEHLTRKGTSGVEDNGCSSQVYHWHCEHLEKDHLILVEEKGCHGDSSV